MKHEFQIDESLDQYAAAVRAFRKTSQARRRSKDWALYTAAAGSALGLASAAEASIVYSGVQNVTLTRNTSFNMTDIDLDANGTVDLSLALYFGSNAGNTFGLAGILLAGSNRAVVNGSNQVRRLSSGNGIGNSQTLGYGPYMRLLFQNSTQVNTYGTWPGGNPTSTSGFAGVRFDAGGGNLFGWLRLRIRNDADGYPDQLTLVDWAYQTDDGVPIQAGQVPEPSSFALLAAGFAGLAAYRRRQKARN